MPGVRKPTCIQRQLLLYLVLLHCATVTQTRERANLEAKDMPNTISNPNYTLDLDRSRSKTIRDQACEAIAQAIRAERAGFRVGERLTALELARHNAIHRNTLINVMNELVRQGFLRRLPNKGFEVIHPAPERPALLTQHIFSLTEEAQRSGFDSSSQAIPEECGARKARELAGPLARVRTELALDAGEEVAVLARCRLLKRRGARRWGRVAIEQSFIPAGRVPNFLDAAMQQIEREGDFSVYRQLRRTFPTEEFFKAHYEISLLPLPQALAAYWTPSPYPPTCVIAITFCSLGPVEFTRTWFDPSRVVLLAGSLEVMLTQV